MNTVTLASGMLLAGIANMLGLYGIDSSDTAIAKGLEAPYLLLLDENGYTAGTGLYQPKHANLYLHPRGFHMSEHRIPKAETAAFLRDQRCALLTLNVTDTARRMVVYSGYADRKYHFLNLKQRFSMEPDTLSFASTALRNRLDAEVTVYTLEECPPVQEDVLSLLILSLKNIQACRKELAACPARVSQEEFDRLDKRLFRPLMQDVPPVVSLINDETFLEEALLMNQDYRHLLIRDFGQDVLLRGKLPLESAMLCLQYLHEVILDRMYEHGADDELLESLSPYPAN